LEIAMKKFFVFVVLTLLGIVAWADGYVFEPGHPSLKVFVLGDVPFPADNKPSAARFALGQKLFFDPRMSGDGNMSCATCHNPGMGWSDGLPTARGVKSSVLGRASPTIFNTAYNSLQMWDGRKKSLEDQAMGPMQANVEMNMDIGKLFQWIGNNAGYKALFAKAYPGEPIDETTLSKAIANFERTVVSNDSGFDRWVRGDAKAMTAQQVEGFKLFVGKANCAVCHSGPNFTDNGFHNLGLASWGANEPDMGRYAQKPVNAMKGAFKTPTVREVTRTAPYFHDGSARTLMEVVEHYDRGGVVKTHLSPNIKPLGLSSEEKLALVSFLESLSSPFMPLMIPELPAR
jgi:cytochrome c peroxidase